MRKASRSLLLLIAFVTFVYSASAQIQTAGTLFVNIDATAETLGNIPWVTNSGTLGGVFEARGGAATMPRIAIAGTSGTRGIQFDGGDYMQHVNAPGGALILAPAGLVGLNPTRSIEVWALNPTIDSEETLLSWGRRGGPDGSNMAFNYGNHNLFGAVGHWGQAGPDLAWNDAGGAPQAGVWHHLVYTFDGQTTRVYADGVLQNSEFLGPGVINTHANLPINLATQIEADGVTPTPTLRGSLTLARVRIHDGVLTPAQIVNNYQFEKAAFQDPSAVPLAAPPAQRYSFNEPAAGDASGLTFSDSVGSAHGTVRGAGASFTGTRLVLNGGASTTAAYGDLPNGLLSAKSADNAGPGAITIEGWIKLTGNRSSARIFDLGSTTGGELTGPGGGGPALDSFTLFAQVSTITTTRRVEIRNNDGAAGGANTLDYSTANLTNDLHFAVTWKESTGEIFVYENGQPVAAMLTDERISSINDINNWLARANTTSDQNAQIEYDEIRIYNHALSPNEVRGTFDLGPNIVNIAGPAGIHTQPQPQTVIEGSPVTFTVGAAGSPPFTYQWRRNGSPISGATTATYNLPAAPLSENGVSFSVIVTNVIGGTPHSVTSSDALLTVLADTNGPTLVAATALSLSSIFVLDAVQVEFSEPLLASTATNSGNYSLSGPAGNVGITSATLDSNQRTVLLTSASPLTQGATYTLRVSNVRDRSTAANAIAPNSPINFIAGFTLRVIGSVTASNSVTAVSGGFDVQGAGRDIGANGDDFAFLSQFRTGDFDLQVRVDSLGLNDGYSEAGLMARQGESTNGPFAAVLASGGLGGVKFQSRAAAGQNAISTGSLPVNYPYTWLRLRRTGNTFTGFGGFDGQTWMLLGSATVDMPSQIYVGFAVSSHDRTRAVTAQFRDTEIATGGTIVNYLALPFEPLGPSSRRTGLAISEIMYHPLEVPGYSLEFIEIFNGQDYYEDLSGFRLDGDIHYTFPNGTILQSGGLLVVARDPAALESYYGIAGVLGPWRMDTNVVGGVTNITPENLPNSRGTVRLENELGAHLLEVNYDSEGDWPASADGAGHSLVLARPSYGENNVRAWGASEFIGGSPGRRESYFADPLRSVVINEFLAHTDDPQVDFIELFNTSTQPINIGSCWLSDDFGAAKFPIPEGTVLAPRSWIAFDQNQLGFNLSSDGEEILFLNPDGTRVLDALRFEGQANGVSRGRWPDGAGGTAPSRTGGFVELSTPTAGANNAAPLARDIVINEIMYNPISGDDNDEYIELYNRGSNPVNVGDWRFVDGINFVVPANTVINPGGYLVIAENRTNLLARYPGLNPNLVVGDYGGQLANGGERVALGMPDYSFVTNGSLVTTNVFYVVVDEVTYGDGGRWGEWSDGGGSSLELIDPDADNRLAANWADSDETAKAPWSTIEREAPIELGMTLGNGPPNRCEFFIEGPGECLVDDVEVLSNGGTNRVMNPGFESGAAGWAFQGTHAQTTVQTGGAFAGAQCLHLRAVERGDPGPNRVRTAVANLPTGSPNRATLRARVRWLRGDPNFLIRIRGQWLECAGRMTLPTNLGTPGAANSRRVSNAGPVVHDVAHTPPLPAANEPVIVTARANDPDGVAVLTLRYRVDPNSALNDVTMRDDGSGGDAIAGDGIYSGTIPGRPADTLIAFHLRAQDGASAQALFPNDAPTRECLVRFGETLRPGSIATYRLWVTDSNIAYWTARERNSNEGLDATFVYGNSRVIYNAQTLYSGSPWHTLNGPYNGPLNNTCDYEVNFPPDDRLLGASDFVLNSQNPVYSGTFHQDVSAQAETTAYWFGRKLGLGVNHKRHVFVVMNGRFRGMIYFDHQQPNREIIDEYFPNDSNGRLHKIEDWFEFDDAGNGFDIITCTLQDFVVGGQKRTERYRWTWRPRAGTAPNDFADLFALADAANATGPEPYTSATLGLVDMRNWMRVFALQQMIGNWDSYGYERGKNMYAYKPTRGPWQLVLWDLDLVLGKDSHAPNNPLFDMNNSEPVIMRMYQHPPFVREYWRTMHELVNVWMLPAVYSPLVEARYAAFQANEVPVDSPDSGQSAGASGGMRGWIAARRLFILPQIPAANFNVTGTNFIQTANNYITLNGTAPVTAAEILVNGATYPITWSGVTTWSLRVPVGPGTNTLIISAVDGTGNSLSNRTITVNYTGPTPDPDGSVVINEIMFNPPVDQTAFIELFNAQSSYAFDLSGWRVNGLSYRFPAGSVLPGRSYLVLARNRGEFAKLYGGTRPVFSEFDGALDNDGETLSLFRPDAQPGEEILVDKVKFEARRPWPSSTSGAGSSLQLIDPVQDNARVSNWSDGKGWRFFSLSGIPNSTRVLMYLNPGGNLYLDDFALVAGNVPAAGSNYIVNGGFEAPLAPAWNLQGANGINTAISTDARFTGNQGLDLRFNPAGGATQFFYQDVPNIVSTAPHTLSFWYLPSTNAGNFEIRMSTGFRATIPVRAPPESQVVATPGTNNTITVPLPLYPLLWLNEVLPVNASSVTDSQGEREPWIELYNSSDTPISLQGFFLTDDYLNLNKWAFPASAVVNPGEFKVVFGDGEAGETTAGEWHTSFRIAPGTGSIALTRFANGIPQIVDYLNFDNLVADRSYGSYPDGQLFDRQEFFYPTPGASNNAASPPIVVYINEWMAANSGFIRDPADNDADDWFELYNPNPYPVDLGGAFLTDNLTNVAQFYEIPDNGHYTISPFGYLLVWADEETQQNSTNRADLHVNFQLRQAGEEIGLFASDYTLIDSVTFGRQTNNISQGRYPAGTGPTYFMTAPSPGRENPDPNPSTAPEILSISNVNNTQVTFVVSTIPGRTYRALYKPDLAAADWSPLGADQTATGSTLSFQDTITGGQRFYTVILLP
jgi:CotH protein/lamin tail-like protein/concanavalin A-like lectin/glucanase superfamily protein/Big-like domain-containing protein